MTRQALVLAFGVAVLVSVSATTVSAQVPAGGEFQVNTYTTDYQWFPVVNTEADGDFEVVWIDLSGQDGDASGVFGQRYGRDGAPRGAEFQVNSYTASYQGFMGGADIAGDGRGDFVVVWSSLGQDGSSWGVFGRRFDASGAPAGAEFQVNSYTTGNQGGYFQGAVGVAQAGDSSFVVVWNSLRTGYDILGQRFDASGTRLGGEFLVNSYTGNSQLNPDIAMDASGGFVVVWSSFSQDGSSWGVFGQRFDASANALGGEFQVNTYTVGPQGGDGYFGPALARSASGDFVVVWDDAANLDGGGNGIFAQRFDASGSPEGGEFQVNTYTTSWQIVSTVSMDPHGSFVVSWSSEYQDGSAFGVFAQRFTADGVPRGGEFQVNSYTLGSQFFPEIGTDQVGNFTVAWFDQVQDGSEWGVFAQRFGGLFPDALAVDSGGNGVIEPGETASVAPSWRNRNGASQTFGGVLANLTGPAGPTYTITDASADHGTVPNGAASACTDCYSVTVSGTRPALHWDATADETITPDAHGQLKTWRLHIGDSFTDVPKTSSYYRFIETLLHKSITGGCTASTYCPTATASRQQMAIFVLKAKEGGDYSPPACGTPMFADVPATNPYCRWIEELSRRGVVGGCGGGNYCPTNAVTRQQMPIFVLKTLDPAIDPPACGTPMFADVPATSPYCRWIEELARRGVVAGCGGGNYCPANPVTRGQMAVFLTVTFSLALYGL